VIGHTTYDIKFYEDNLFYGRIDAESKLEFDLNATILNLGFESFFFNDRFQLRFNYGQSVITHGGNFRDRDWINNDLINLYYEPLMGDTDSDVDSDLKRYEVIFRWNILNIKDRIRLFANCGYEHQTWGTFKARNIEGFYSGLLSDSGYIETFSETYSFDVLTYDVEYDIYYCGVGLDFNLKDKWIIEVLLDLGSVYAEDKDDHVLRMKMAESETDGLYIGLKVSGGIKITRYFIIKAFVSLKTIDTDGTQYQYEYDYYGNPTVIIGDVSDEITSDQTYFGIKGTVVFG
ncbi:hypothetical protein BVX93_00020, partial [bacterium B13(2017)]